MASSGHLLDQRGLPLREPLRELLRVPLQELLRGCRLQELSSVAVLRQLLRTSLLVC
jgi:hypothetical protein